MRILNFFFDLFTRRRRVYMTGAEWQVKNAAARWDRR